MDKQQADKLITEYFQKIYGFAVSKSFSYAEAEDLCGDIVQEVYLSLLRAREVICPDNYIRRIAAHVYAKFVSRKKKHEGVSIDMVQLSYEEDFLPADTEEELCRLRREIAFLTEKRRQIVYLFYYENKSISSISKTTGIPEGTIKWHLNKARIELKERFTMERKIGKLGIAPVSAASIAHGGTPGPEGGPEYYLGDKLNLNIVYSVYFTPKTLEEIAEELGCTPVFIEDKVQFLEENGYLIRTRGNRFTTYVSFSPRVYTAEWEDTKLKKQMEIAKKLAEVYVPAVQASIADIQDVYIPGGNRQLLEATAIFYGVTRKCGGYADKDLSLYNIKTSTGGKYLVFVDLEAECADPTYVPQMHQSEWTVCGAMERSSDKYPEIYSWAVNSKLDSRTGGWKDNLYTDYEYLYEYMRGSIRDDTANAEKFHRLRKRGFLTEDNQINVMIIRSAPREFFRRIPPLTEEYKQMFADFILETAAQEAKQYPPQMQDLVIDLTANGFIGSAVAVMLLDELYKNGTFRPLTEQEKAAANLIMFSDILPEDNMHLLFS